MLEGFQCFCCINTPVICMTVYAGVGIDPSVKQNLCGIFWKQPARYIPDTDITLFVAPDTLNRSNTGKWFVTTQTLFFQ